MILVNIHRISRTILLQSREKLIAWESSFFIFFLLTLHYQGVFSKGNMSALRKERSFQSCPDVRGQELKPETTLSYLWPSGRNTGD